MIMENRLFKICIYSLFIITLGQSCWNKTDKNQTATKSKSNAIKKVLLIAYDGCRTDALLAANTPAIDSLFEHSYISLHCNIGTYAASIPSYSTILHGVWANKHGLTKNKFDNSKYNEYPDLFYYLRKARPNLFLASISNWEDFLNITTEENYTQSVRRDENVKEKAICLLDSCPTDVLLLHFDQIDNVGHISGFSATNPDYMTTIEDCDKFTGEIMKKIKLREQTKNEEWMVILTADHGGVDRSHEEDANDANVRYVFLSVRLPHQSRINMNQVDNTAIMPTIMNYLEIKTEESWHLDGKSIF